MGSRGVLASWTCLAYTVPTIRFSLIASARSG